MVNRKSTKPTGLHDRLRAPGPKRILSLDGGGVRGMLTIGFLEALEEQLRDRHDDPDLRLSQYFDLIGGTSVGALLASGLALGMSVEEIGSAFHASVSRAFGRRRVRRWESLFDPGPLKEELYRVVGDRRLDSGELQSALCVVAKRADTQSTWLLTNHPDAQFYESNRHMLLRHVLYASAAAPLYFIPEVVDVGDGELGGFVDGGVSMANNPALQLFLLATLNAYPFQWSRGVNNLLLVSLGTGTWKRRRSLESIKKSRAWDWARRTPDMLIDDASQNAQLMLQSFSDTPTPWPIDREVGSLANERLTPEPLLSYLRYNARLEQDELNDLGLPELVPRVEHLRQLGNAQNADALIAIGRAAATQQMKTDHFPASFDIPQA